MKYRFFRFVCLFLLSLLLVTACNGTKTVTSHRNSPPLRVAYIQWSGFFPMIIAQEKGFFTQQGVKVEPVYVENYIASLSDFSAGKYDGVTISVGSLMSIIGKTPDARVVLVTDQSAGGDAVLGQPDIQNVADLKGKRIGTKIGDFGELLVITMLERNGLTTDDVTLVNTEAETIPARLQGGDIQAGQTWDPYISEAVKAGAKVLFSTKETPGLIPGVMVFHNNILINRPNDVQAFTRAWFQAVDYWKANPEEGNALIAQKFNIKPEEVSLNGLDLFSQQDALKAMTPGTTTESLYYTAKLYADYYIRTGGLTAAPDIQKLIDPSFVQQLK
ncbi:ABC transporter substrate-binding protein [Microcoleus sp. FACHB-672]|uniref:ABC transporter substrate-binding protein n=1 Tax=Microcoleus sp. FACHB-672 TaxID=2692825 RepID=UPI001688E1A7|nr:ABC transporter substrate-binding protein [Microcoleus sp. FACHB-672]MBD2042847.1 ABC transporter substrate-binding protein [Microcoleus sp. FACHB-672]